MILTNLIRKLNNLYFAEDKKLTRKLRPILGFTPARLYLFKTAFFHKSMANENPDAPTNERLEYLGDAILSTVVAEYLYNKYPNQDEGFLTKMRSKIVKRQTLNQIAADMGIDVVLSDYSMGRMSHAMLGNAFEALMGAIYLEMGYNRARDYIIHNILRKYLDLQELERIDDNHKSQLLEWCQKYSKEISFETLAKFKVDKRDCFKVAVIIDGQEISTAEDFNKKSAEQSAALKAINKLKINSQEKENITS